MRALYIENIKVDQGESEIELNSVQYNHIKKVVRLRTEDELLILNGNGNEFIGTFISYGKKSIRFQLKEKLLKQRSHNISVALIMPKKEAFEDIVQSCIQLGVKNLFTYSAKFSQSDYLKPSDRLSNIMIGAYQQSNNPFSLTLHITRPLDEIVKIKDMFKKKYYLTSIDIKSEKVAKIQKEDEVLIVIGPEGGLSTSEEQTLLDQGFGTIHLPTPILRSPIAVTTAIGHVLALL